MNPIKSSDLYKHDDSVIQAAINQLHGLDTAMTKISENIEKNKKLAIALAKAMNSTNATNKKNRKTLTEQEKEARKLAAANTKLKRVYSKTNLEIAEVNGKLKTHRAIIRNTVKNVDAANTSYNKLSSQYALNKIKLEGMTTAQIKYTASGRKLLKETRELHKAMDVWQKSTGKHIHSIGNYGTATKKLAASMKNLAYAYVGIGAIQQGVRFFVDTTAELDAMRFASEKIIDTQGEQIATTIYLNDITSKFGGDILKVTKSYLKFKAAIKSSNITAQQGQDVFTTFSKASASLGLTAADNELVFLALEQMISKGCMGYGSEVLMYDKTVKYIQDLVIGDCLMGDDYTKRYVISTQRGRQMMYEISFNDGYKVVVNSDHKMPFYNGEKKEIVKINWFVNYIPNKSQYKLEREGIAVDFEIKKIGEQDYYGVELTGNHLYLDVEGVTHCNTVSAEELRRQLGEKIPGSVSIMAKSMNVSVEQLGKLLKQGKVFTEDVLVKFSKQLEETYGISTTNKVDTLRVAQDNLGNSWKKLVGSMGGSNVLKSMYKSMASGVNYIADNISGVYSLLKGILSLVVGIGTYRALMVLANRSILKQIVNIAEATYQFTLQDRATKKLIISQVNLNKAMSKNIAGVLITGLISLGTYLVLTIKKIDTLRDRLLDLDETQKTAVLDIEKRVNALAVDFLGDNDGKKSAAIEQLNELLKNSKASEGIEIFKEDDKDFKNKLQGLKSILEIEEKIKNTQKLIDEVDRFKPKATRTVTGGYNSITNTSSPDYEVDNTNYDKELEKYNKRVQGLKDNVINLKASLGFAVSDLKLDDDFGTPPPDGGTPDPDKYKEQELKIEAEKDEHVKRLLQIDLDYLKDKEAAWNKSGEFDSVLQTIKDNAIEEEMERHGEEMKRKNADRLKIEDEATKERISLLEDGQRKEILTIKFNASVKLRAYKEGSSGYKKVLKEEQRDINKVNKKYNDLGASELEQTMLAELKLSKKILKVTAKTEEDFRKGSIVLDIAFWEWKKAIAKKGSEGVTSYTYKDADATIKLLKKQLADLLDGVSGGASGGGNKDIWDVLDIEFKSPEQKDMFKEVFNNTANYIAQYVDGIVEQYDRILAKAEEVSAAAAAEVDKQKERKEQGLSNNYNAAKKEYKQAKELEEKALKDKKKAQKVQLALNSISEASNMAVALSKAYAEGGGLLGIVAGTAMLVAFALAKAKAFELANQEYGDGGYEFLQGGSHASGNDIPIGRTSDGRQRKAEGGEFMSIIKKSSTAKYKNILPSITDSLNDGTFHLKYGFTDSKEKPSQVITNNETKVVVKDKSFHFVPMDDKIYVFNNKREIVETINV